MYGEHSLLITYDLRNPGRDYKALYEVLKSARTWAHPVESVWFVRTSESAQTWHDKLLVKMDANDKLLVYDLDTGWWVATRLQSDVVEWMRTNLKVRTVS